MINEVKQRWAWELLRWVAAVNCGWYNDSELLIGEISSNSCSVHYIHLRAKLWENL